MNKYCLECGIKLNMNLNTEQDTGLCIKCYYDTINWNQLSTLEKAELRSIGNSLEKEVAVRNTWELANFGCLPVTSLRKTIQ